MTTQYCNCCEQELNPKRTVELWYSNTTDRYYRTEAELIADDAQEGNQGVYFFGTTCARKALAENP